MTFAVAGCLLVALNRLYAGMAGATRFVAFSTLFWIGAAWALGGFALRQRGRSYALTVTLAGVVLCALPILQHIRLQQNVQRYNLERTAQMLLLGIREERPAGEGLAAPEELMHRITDRLRDDRRSFFADRVALLPGASLGDNFAVAPAGRCSGSVDRPHGLFTVGDPAVEVSGFVWDNEVEIPPSLVVVTDSSGRIDGLGSVFLSVDEPRQAAWVGYLPRPKVRERYFVYGVLVDGRSVCRIAEFVGPPTRRRRSGFELFKHHLPFRRLP
jgi:hypothetical protein